LTGVPSEVLPKSDTFTSAVAFEATLLTKTMTQNGRNILATFTNPNRRPESAAPTEIMCVSPGWID
jgi:hypothetical protein